MSIPTTRLGDRLRKEVDKRLLDTSEIGGDGWRALDRAAKLDRAVYSLGRRGEDIRLLGAYRDACSSYKIITGEEYIPTPKGG